MGFLASSDKIFGLTKQSETISTILNSLSCLLVIIRGSSSNSSESQTSDNQFSSRPTRLREQIGTGRSRQASPELTAASDENQKSARRLERFSTLKWRFSNDSRKSDDSRTILICYMAIW
ncbi:hypothetical protein Ccrd_023460 [Cynara cardunculus var. scolymus]|uniref:Uncharacterized protein n=1 Tax=Cynara cardunculus var. scolymus TaxID=59895 RepID=A0A124SDX3_CYNCS|nr:hypothetical protein Ccrd_023460 [Cynara cardunculus var. scolymus]